MPTQAFVDDLCCSADGLWGSMCFSTFMTMRLPIFIKTCEIIKVVKQTGDSKVYEAGLTLSQIYSSSQYKTSVNLHQHKPLIQNQGFLHLVIFSTRLQHQYMAF